MKIDFLKNISILLITNILVRPLYIFGVDLKVQNLLGPQEYGLYFIVFDFVYLFLFINDPGLQSYSAKTIAQNRENPQLIISQIVSLKFLLSLAYIAVSVLMAYLAGFDERRIWLVLGVSTGLVLASVFVLLRSFFSGLGLYKYDSYLSSLDKVLMVIIIGSLVWGFYGSLERIEQVIFLQNICYLVAIGFVFALLFRHIKPFHFNFNFSVQLSLLKQTLPYSGLILLTAICNRIDVVMLDFLRVDGAYQSGLYAAGYRFLDAANMFGFLFGALLLPMYAHNYVNKKEINELFNTAFQVLMIISIFITLILCLYGKEIFGLLYTAEYLPHYNIMVALMLSLVPIMVAHSVGSLLVGTGKIFWMNITYAIGIVVNIILNFIFIPKYGALGSAYTTLVTEIFLIVTSIILAKSLCNVRIYDFLLRKILLLTIIAILIILIFKTYVDINWMIQVGLIACVYVSFLFILKLVNFDDWRRQLAGG